eukprot:4325362-Prymnesium_polylepis.1
MRRGSSTRSRVRRCMSARRRLLIVGGGGTGKVRASPCPHKHVAPVGLPRVEALLAVSLHRVRTVRDA